MNIIPPGSTEHCHGLKPDLVPALKLKNKIKHELLKQSSYQVHFCILQFLSFPLDAACQLPQSETFSRSIHRQRQVSGMSERMNLLAFW